MKAVNTRKLFLFSLLAAVFASALSFLPPASPDVAWSSTAEIRSSVPTISKDGEAFLPGEVLTYTISWSKVFSAGTAVMEVKKEQTPEGKDVLRFVSTAKSIGMVEKVYPVRDIVQSLYDPVAKQSLLYSLKQSHGSKKRNRDLTFDHQERKVLYVSEGAREFVDIKEQTQDALSSLYYLRTRHDFIDGKTIVLDIHDSGKNWAVEVHVLGRERIKTPVGEFNTVKVKTYPKYEGVFMHKGEIFMWLTDDHRRIPVLMKSTITIGSVVATLSEMKPGEIQP